ncbi:MAG: hypothetical protein M3440_14525, partial [Chloroflexota bacterium]|nr:hypothetical protein [Chloroflexota bacterium]
MKPRQRLGAVLLVAVISIAGITMSDLGGRLSGSSGSADGDLTVVSGYGGQLKVNFLDDPEVAAILADRYGLEVDITKAGSIEMLCDLSLEDKDFIWAGDQSSLGIYRDCGGTMVRSDNVYNSPIVLYSWTPVVDALVADGIAQPEAGGAYSVDFARLADHISEGTSWTDLGVPALHGRVTVHTTDPARSNSGYLFAGLLANAMNGGDVVNATTMQPLLPGIGLVFERLGFMEETSGDLFEQFLTTGMGAKPIVAGYESQLLEFLMANPDARDQVGEQVRILYPQPTVWASHPMVARTAEGARLLDALMDPEIQRLAWDRHGHRAGVAGVVNDTAAMAIPGLLPSISSVVDMPAPSVMTGILAEIESPAGGAATDTGDYPAERIEFQDRKIAWTFTCMMRCRRRVAWCRASAGWRSSVGPV